MLGPGDEILTWCAYIHACVLQDGDPEREDLGDLDLWALAPDHSRLVVNPRWLAHLQLRVLGQDGHPRRSRPADDDACNGRW